MGTPWEGDSFFGDGSIVRSHLTMPAAWADLVRLMLLHKYGHFWMDNDVVLYRGEACAGHPRACARAWHAWAVQMQIAVLLVQV